MGEPSDLIESRARSEQADPGSSTRCALVVLGSYGDGESEAARCLSSVGAALPRSSRRRDAHAGLPAAESEPIMSLHEEVLESAGSSWDDVLPFPESWHSSPEAEECRGRLRRLVDAEYTGSPLFVVEDPRICRLVPLWLAVLDALDVSAAFVIPVRSPLEVAAWLEDRHRVPFGKGILMWLRNALEAERATRGRPRAFVAHESLTSDWQAVGRAICESLGLSPAEGYAGTGDRSNGAKPSEREPHDLRRKAEGHGQAISWAGEAYELLLDACGSGRPVESASLDAIRAALADVDRGYRPALLEARLRAEEVERRLEVREKQFEARERALEDARDTRSRELEAKLEKSRRELSGLREELDQRAREAAELRELLASVRESISWRLTAPLRWLKALVRRAMRRG